MKKTLDRFEIVRILGHGSQGKVYLCRDPRLERLVAIKLLNQNLLGGGGNETELLNEARTMSRVNHANIVSVFDMGSQGKQPFLVFEYVDGETVKDKTNAGRLATPQALNVIEGVLSGMARAHEQGIVHRDLKPANIMLDHDGVPKITDFGIARILSGQGEVDSELVGTPRYMAPEYIRSGKVLMQSDVFSIGLVAYELLTGKVAYDGKNAMELLRRISEEPVAPPSKVNPDVDDKLERLLLKALEKDPYARFDDAAAMLEAWREYRRQAQPARDSSGSGNSTVDFLLRRIQHKSDFPALSRTVSTLNQLSRSEDKDISELTNLIIKDYGLTSKILKVVNSAYYGHFSGTIGTVSRAIVVIGTKGIRSIAASLALLDHFGSSKEITKIKDQLAESLFSAVMARELMSELQQDAIEEAFLGALLHNLGHILVSFYLPEEEAEVRRLVDNEEIAEQRAQMAVLNTTYDRIGQAVAEQWNFPGNIRECLVHDADDTDKPAKSKAQKLRMVTRMSNELTATIRKAEPEERGRAILHVQEKYKKALRVNRKNLGKALNVSNKEFVDFQTDFATRRDKQRFLNSMSPSSAQENERGQGAGDVTGQAEDITVVVEDDGRIERRVGGGEVDREQMLSEGMQESTMLLVNRAEIGQLVNLVLETLYRSMRFNRIIACLFDRRRARIVGRTGMGDEVQVLIDGFQFKMNGGADVFNLALGKGADIYIKDATQKSFQTKLPPWFKSVSQPGSFFILPLVADGRPLGMLYAEYDRVDGFDEDPQVLSLIKALRSQLVLGIMSR